VLVCTSHFTWKAKDMRRHPRVALSVVALENPGAPSAVSLGAGGLLGGPGRPTAGGGPGRRVLGRLQADLVLRDLTAVLRRR
jgi:hypothetical protein